MSRLARGGGKTLSIGLRHLNLFSRLGVFSAGSNNPQDAFKDVAANAKRVDEQLELLWMTGDPVLSTPTDGSKRNSLWAKLMQRSFGFDVLACPRCGDRLELIALIDNPPVIRRIVSHLGLPTEVPAARPARPPPLPVGRAA